jgi:hypothetical protein
LLGTHGLPLQQSALDEHAVPASTHAAPVQRGIPRLSRLQVSSVLQLPVQQLQSLLQLVVASLQTSPFGMQAFPASEPPVGLRQMPTVSGALMTHVTRPAWGSPLPAPPQHCALFVQMSPSILHPDAGWQTSTPVGPHGAHARLQHEPPHAGTPPSWITMPPSGVVPAQSVPSGVQELAGPVGAEPQIPSACVPVMVQTCEQQSAPVAQASPVWPQYDGCWQRPATQ